MTACGDTKPLLKYRSFSRHAVLVTVALACFHALSGCAPEPKPLANRVLLMKAQFLEEPAVAADRNVYKPALRLSVGSQSDVVAFKLTVQAATDELLIQATARSSGQSTLLERIEPPEASNGVFSQIAEAAGARHADLLDEGKGFYWIVPLDNSVSYQISVVLPDFSADPFWMLKIASQTVNGVLIAGLDIELVKDFFYLVVVGDSVQWGNGLEERDKMSTLVSHTIETELGKSVIFQRYAISGGTIHRREGDGVCLYNCFGEVPKEITSIIDQVDQVKRPDLVQLVIADGCINDVNVANIVNPSETPESVAEMARAYCGEGMIELLHKIRSVIPDAAIVITGYYQIVSPQSDVLGLNAWLQTQGKEPAEPDDDGLVSAMTANSISFLETAHTELRNAIASVSAETPSAPPIAFADPGFGADNAVFAPDAWLWGMTAKSDLLETLGINLELAPMDAMMAKRLARCLSDDDLPIGQLIICLYASVGHPTPAGAEAFAASITAQLREIGVLPQ